MSLPNHQRVAANRFGLLVPALAAFLLVALSGCGSTSSVPATAASTNPLAVYQLQGNTSFIHDPTIIRQGTAYYVLSTDGGQGGQPAHLLLAGQVELDPLRAGLQHTAA